MAGLARVREFAEQPVENRPQIEQEADYNKGIEIDDITFAYENAINGGINILNSISVTLKPGEKSVFVGRSGAGKTTLVNLLMRFYEVDSGEILIDTIPIDAMRRKDLHSHIGMVLQDTWLFKGTIRENIAFGKRGATDEEVVQAATLAYADGFIRTLPKGYDTEINEEGGNISQGQKQLITIARALILRPHIMILDEATSSVDTRTEALVQKAMKRMMEGYTSFVIAHRLSTIQDADNILVMNGGNIIEQGSHVELLARRGFYFELYNSQFEDGNSHPA